jgi:electron transport complex protein RnfG
LRENIKLGVILFLITAIAGILLGLAYEVTKEPIAKQAESSSMAVAEILPQAKAVKKADVSIPKDSIVKQVSAGYDGDKLVGYAVRVNAKGFHGDIDMVLGISLDDKIQGIKIIAQTETAGLGANIVKPDFTSQFKGKPIENPIEVVKSGASADNQVDAVTGATLSSKGVVSGINTAIDFYKSDLKGKGGQQ